MKLVLTNSKNSQSVSNVGDCIEGTSEAAIGAESSFALWATNLLSLFTFVLNQLLSTAPVAVLACSVLVNCEMTMLGSHWHHKAPKVEKKNWMKLTIRSFWRLRFVATDITFIYNYIIIWSMEKRTQQVTLTTFGLTILSSVIGSTSIFIVVNTRHT